MILVIFSFFFSLRPCGTGLHPKTRHCGDPAQYGDLITPFQFSVKQKIVVGLQGPVTHLTGSAGLSIRGIRRRQ